MSRKRTAPQRPDTASPIDVSAGTATPAERTAAQVTSTAQKKPVQDDGQIPLSRAARRANEIRGAAYRETVESIAVAIILALLFRGFVAEAFVIPTGSMAPSLMGAHKDIFCSQCGTQYQVGASIEDRTVRSPTPRTVIGTICPNCRYVHRLDLEAPADATFSGDRILVSKFAYALSDPKRWEVAVFKFPGNPKQNYIKRLVGLPEETLMVHHGDVYVRPTESGSEPPNLSGVSIDDRSFVIQRKPADKLAAMAHHVHDTDQQAVSLIDAGYPSPWQPWRPGAEKPPTDSWTLEASASGLIANVQATGDQQHWLRFYPRYPTLDQWEKATSGGSLRDVDPYSSEPILDFYSYNTFLNVSSDNIYEVTPEEARASQRGLKRLTGVIWPPKGEFLPGYKTGDFEQFRDDLSIGGYNTAAEGMHWVGDLILDADIETSNESKSLLFEIVEAGVRYQCAVDLESGVATLQILEADDTSLRFRDQSSTGAQDVDDSGADSRRYPTVTGQTDLLAGGRHHVRFSNADDELTLMIDGELVEFDRPATFDHRDFRKPSEDRPRFTAEHPLDAAPLAIAVRGGSAVTHRLKVDRDKYYIATKESSDGLLDYDLGEMVQATRGRGVSSSMIQSTILQRDRWDDFAGWAVRRTVAFTLEEDQFFPMGDNSPESKDARCWVDSFQGMGPRSPDPFAYHWADKHYVPRDLMVGKAVMVFWPHPWNEPVPFTPNFKRIGLIR